MPSDVIESERSPAVTLSTEQSKAVRNVWLLLSATTVLIAVGSTAPRSISSLRDYSDYIVYATYASGALLVLGGLYATSIMSKFVSPARTMRSIGGRSWVFKTGLVLFSSVIASVFAITFLPLKGLLSEFGENSSYATYGVPALLYTSFVLFALTLVSLSLRVHSLPDVAGSEASMIADATSDNLEEAAIEAIRTVVTRVSGETDTKRVSRVSKLVAQDRIDPVLDRLKDRDTTLVAVTPFDLESNGVVGNTVSVGGSRLISADGCKSVTYTLNWVADMVKIDGSWKLYGVRGAETQS